MSRTIIASLALALAIPGLAVPALAGPAPEPITFTHDGVKYVYTVTPASGGRRVIEGTADGASFRLVAGKHRVSGTFEYRSVAFEMSEVRALPERERVAAR